MTGKGGVGKTTACAALGSALARRGRRVLICVSGLGEQLSGSFDSSPLTHDVKPLARNVWGIHLDPETSIGTYGAMVLHSRTLSSRLFDNRYVKSFFNAIPGLHAWAILGHAWHLANEVDEDGGARFDCVLMDAPATGHGLEMLGVPKVIMDVAPKSALRRDAEAAWQMFCDATQSGVVLVTLPEELPVTEVLELGSTLQGKLGLPIAGVVVNWLYPDSFSSAGVDELLVTAPCVSPKRPVEVALNAAIFRAQRQRIQETSLRRLESLPGCRVELPPLFELPGTPEGLNQLIARFLPHIGSADRAVPSKVR